MIRYVTDHVELTYCNLKDMPPLCGDPQMFTRLSDISNPMARILDNSKLRQMNDIALKSVSKVFAPAPWCWAPSDPLWQLFLKLLSAPYKRVRAFWWYCNNLLPLLSPLTWRLTNSSSSDSQNEFRLFEISFTLTCDRLLWDHTYSIPCFHRVPEVFLHREDRLVFSHCDIFKCRPPLINRLDPRAICTRCCRTL